MKSICIVTGSRAEYGILKELIRLFYESKNHLLQLVVTGSHLSDGYGYTVNEIIEDGFNIDYKIDLLLGSDNNVAISKSIGLGLLNFADCFSSLKPDLIIILGDRYEMLSVAITAMMQRIPIAHIHGGEVTEGAIDDKIRHSISKMSEIHFVANAEYKKRLIQLGERPSTIHLTGSLGVDAIRTIKFMTKLELEESMNFSFGDKNLILTYHPETLNIQNIENDFDNVIHAIKDLNNINFIITLPNSDEGNKLITNKIYKLQENQANIFIFNSLGQKRYLSCLNYVDGVIGNSSSGILEVPSFKIGTINIGNRQKGRIKATSIIDCKPVKSEIIESINYLYSETFQSLLKNTTSPYGLGNSSEMIFKIVSDLEFPLNIKRNFYDLNI